jgi:hypothetical protein
LAPDYSQSTSSGFLKAAWAAIQHNGHLTLLHHTNNRQDNRKVSRHESWYPRWAQAFSEDHDAYPFDWRSFYACGHVGMRYANFTLEGQSRETLEVEGCVVGIVSRSAYISVQLHVFHRLEHIVSVAEDLASQIYAPLSPETEPLQGPSCYRSLYSLALVARDDPSEGAEIDARQRLEALVEWDAECGATATVSAGRRLRRLLCR